jgi:predicted nucleic acid-binding Zn finger protein
LRRDPGIVLYCHKGRQCRYHFLNGYCSSSAMLFYISLDGMSGGCLIKEFQ